MNNSAPVIVIKAKTRDEAIELSVEGSMIAQPDTISVKALRFLKDNVHWKVFVKSVLGAEISRERGRLESEQDPIKVYRLQGYIQALEKMKDLDRFEKIYQAKVDRNNGKK